MNTLPQKHDILWLPDGNVVLTTDDFLFRVHKSVLSFHSTIFRDMFDLPLADSSADEGTPTTDGQPDGGIRPDVYEGLPMVQLMGDKGEDVAHLLRAIFQRGYYNRDDDNTPLDTITALLSLSAKYDVETVRGDVLMQLKRNYPTTLAEYEAISKPDDSTVTLFGRPRKDCHFPLLRAASITSHSQTDIQIILPTLYYACSGLPINKIIAEEAPLLPLPTLQTLLLGERYFDYVIRMQLSLVLDSNSPTAGCPQDFEEDVCIMRRRCPQTPEMTRLFSTTVLSDVTGPKVVDVFFERRCEMCRNDLFEALDTLRTEMWRRVPGYFGFTTWADL